MKKQFLRVKQIADQTFLRAEKTEALTEDLIEAEKRVDTIKQSCHAALKKINGCQVDFGSENLTEKRMKKIPQFALATSMVENGLNFPDNSILGSTLKECGQSQSYIGEELLKYYDDVEKFVVTSLSSVLENEIHNITKLRKQLGRLTLDMDSARSRFLAAERHSIQSASGANLNAAASRGDKVDVLKDELDEASQKVEQCRDSLASEMFALLAKEPQLSEILIQFHRLQAAYHRKALEALESKLPLLEANLSNFPQKPIFGCPIEEHLRVTNRQIAVVIERCVEFLLEFALSEEGLLRVAGSPSKLKKLKGALNAGIDIDMTEYLRDPHAVAGVLKSYLRDLPEPLLTYSLYDSWMSAARVPQLDQRAEAMNRVLYQLPEINFSNLQFVVRFLFKLNENSGINKMSSHNIAIIMAPNLIRSPVEDSSSGMNMLIASLQSSVVDMLISRAEYFFPDLLLFESSKGNHFKNDSNQCVLDAECSVLTSDVLDSSIVTPKSIPRVIRKPAAPSPPANKEIQDKITEKLPTCNEKKGVETRKLINVSSSSSYSSEKCTSGVNSKLKTELLQSSTSSQTSAAMKTIIRRRSNENIVNANLSVSSKGDKPEIPEKPTINYSTYSLDRAHNRESCIIKPNDSAKGNEWSSTWSRQRPTVPPPDRPTKPSRLSMLDNVCAANVETSHKKFDSAEQVIDKEKSYELFEELSELVCSVNNESKDSDAIVLPPTLSQTVQTNVKCNVNQNKFDFITTQSTDKPPQRPPRSVTSVPEQCEIISVDVEQKVSTAVENDNLTTSPTSNNMSGECLVNISPISQRRRPPRPHPPPVPYNKPKQIAEENTNL